MATDLAPPASPKSPPKGRRPGRPPKSPRPDPVAARPARVREAAMLLKQTSDHTRLHILLILDQEPRDVGAICDALGGISQPACSHHLALMRHGRLIEPTRIGKRNVYSLCPEGRRLVEAVRVLVDGPAE